MILLTVTLGLAALVLLLPSLSDLASLFRARPRPPLPAAAPSQPRLLFLVPAHNEESLIGECVDSLRRQAYPPDCFSVVVIADNCTDRTASLARAAGAECLERHDRTLPGKPRAIAWALAQLRVDSADSVIIIDADTVVDPGFASALARRAPLRDRVFQAYFDVANPEDSALTEMAAVLAAANFRIAYPLKRRAGLNAPMVGNGMCIGSGVLATHGWKAFCIAEDWELYALYTTAGVRIESMEDARLYSQEARSLSQSTTQRQRWTAGKLTVVGRHLGGLLRSPRITAWQKLDAAAELTAPGPVVQVGIAALGIVATGLLRLPAAAWLAGGFTVPALRIALYAIGGLATRPRPLRTALAFGYLPVYGVWRLGNALGSLKMVGNKPWVRTARH
jgi:cellulose synthase/poly-beta-1,6-N-acetylglucosamine synthase-like glycosyltransferase